MKHINILTVDNEYGLKKDSIIIAKVLRDAGFKVSIQNVGKPTLVHKVHRLSSYIDKAVSYTLRNRPPYDVNLFLEYCFPPWFSYAKVNCLIPNQEWFREGAHSYLPQFDYVLCKTRFAQEIFEKLGCKTEFISFTSFDRFREKYAKNYDKFFHLAGSNSVQKGTKTIIETWLRHPEWPSLSLRQKKNKLHVPAPNIEYITEFLDDDLLSQYQNSHGVHLCPSEAEGFGHYIVEATSCKAVTITTNAPPMNELITPDRGLLADYSHTKIQRLGINYYVDSQSLEQKVNEALGMDYLTKKQLGENARDWYLENNQFFRKRIVEVISDM